MSDGARFEICCVRPVMKYLRAYLSDTMQYDQPMRQKKSVGTRTQFHVLRWWNVP